jgi:hypothetical protein
MRPTGVSPPTVCVCGATIFDRSDGKVTLKYYGQTRHWRNLKGERVVPTFDEDGFGLGVELI